MDYWSALNVLGLEDDDELNREQVRRTYMRRLREHPPERDPEGFRLLREAYEAVRFRVPDAPRTVKEEAAKIVIVDARRDEPAERPSAPTYAFGDDASTSGIRSADDKPDTRADTGYSLAGRDVPDKRAGRDKSDHGRADDERAGREKSNNGRADDQREKSNNGRADDQREKSNNGHADNRAGAHADTNGSSYSLGGGAYSLDRDDIPNDNRDQGSTYSLDRDDIPDNDYDQDDERDDDDDSDDHENDNDSTYSLDRDDIPKDHYDRDDDDDDRDDDDSDDHENDNDSTYSLDRDDIPKDHYDRDDDEHDRDDDDDDSDDHENDNDSTYSLDRDDIPDDGDDDDDSHDDDDDDDDDSDDEDDSDNEREDETYDRHHSIELDELGRPTMSLSTLVDKLLVLMQHEEVNEAIALEREWRERGDTDDHRQTDHQIALRWALTRELLAIAPQLPAPVTCAIAKGIAGSDFDAVRPDLERYRHTNPHRAEEANVIIATRANDIYNQIKGTLYVAPPPRIPQVQFKVPDLSTSSTKSGFSGFSGIWIGLAAVLLLVRIMSAGDCTSSSPRSSYTPPKINLDTLKFRPPDIDYSKLSELSHSLDEPRAIDPTAECSTLLVEASFELSRLLRYEVDVEQRERIEGLRRYAMREDCPKLRSTMKELEDNALDPTQRALKFMAAIRERIDLACPKPEGTRPKPKKKRKPEQ